MWKRVVLLVSLACALAAQTTKQYKDQAEFQLYDNAAKAVAAGDFAAALSNLDSWRQNYADSDYKDDRQFLYVLAYAGAKQPAQGIDAAGVLLSKPDLEAAIPSAANRVRLLYTAAAAIPDVHVPTAAQLEISADAARRLLVFDKTPEGLTPAAWAQARAQLQATARRTLLFVALVPGKRDMEKGDCGPAEQSFRKALEENPDSAQAAWELGSADLCLYKTLPEKAAPAIYAFARAAVADPSKGLADPKWQRDTVEPFLEKVFQQYHGADPAALQQLKELAAKSPLPPAGFEIKSMAQIASEKQADFENHNPQLALWTKIRAALSDADGEHYFADSLQGAAVPRLRGVLLEAKPSCRPTQLFLAIPLPDQASRPSQAEIVLKLDAPLAGKPELLAEVQWEGVPSAFTRSPFLLTMKAERSKIEGLKITPCTPVGKKKR
jgi:hypothetical protein